MAGERASVFDMRVVFGILILIFGLLLLLKNMGYDIGMSLWSYWPVVLIILGLRIMIQPRENRQFVTGLIITLAGVLLILHNLEIVRFGWSVIWPLIIILIGIAIISGHIRRRGIWGTDQNHVDLSMVLGGGDFRFDSKELRGGKINAILGGGKVDLRDADMSGNEMTLDTFAFMGGIELWVPTTWQVIMRGTPILGGMDNKTITRGDLQGGSPKKIIITGVAVLGGIEVKN